MRAVRVENGSVCVVDVPPPQRRRGAGEDEGGRHLRLRPAHDRARGDDGRHARPRAGRRAARRPPVAIEPLAPCGTCELCVAGDYQLCRSAPADDLRHHARRRHGRRADRAAALHRAAAERGGGARRQPGRAAGGRRARLPHGRPARRRSASPWSAAARSASAPSPRRASPAPRSASRRATTPARRRASASARRPIDGEYDVVVECAGSDSAVQRMCELAKPGGTISCCRATGARWRCPASWSC